MKYRSHIDGMRAISVMAVLLYHLGVPRVTGGFVGVDVFFVISGFLISKIIYDELAQTGRFGVLYFYERRARRILPVFVVTTTAALVVGYVFFLPNQFVEISRYALYSTGFAANIFAYFSSDYFSPAAEFQPLLHYWSLGVEEQFYILFPLAIWIAWRISPKHVPFLLLAAAVGSFGWAEIALKQQPAAAFYLPHLRAWELLAGSILALPRFPFPAGRVFREATAALGLLFVLLAIVCYDDKTAFPGLAAALPVLGAFLLIAGCEKGRTAVGDILSLAPIRWIGWWSYSLYMVHWPLIVFSRILFPELDPLIRAAVLGALSVGLAALSFRFIERPFRQPREWVSRKGIFAASASSLVLLAGFATFFDISNGFPARLPLDVQAVLKYDRYDLTAYRRTICFLTLNQDWKDLDQKTCLTTARPSTLLWGDSFAAHYFSALSKRFQNLSQANASGCPPVIGFERFSRPNCKSFNDDVLRWIDTVKPDRVILSAFWPIDKESLDRLDLTLKRLLEDKVEVIILGQVPVSGGAVPDILAKRLMHGNHEILSDVVPNGTAINGDTAMKERYSHIPGIRYISVYEMFCGSGRCPLATVAGVPTQWDSGHFTSEGAELAVHRTFDDKKS